MANIVYETHSMRNPLLPFIYHHKFVMTQRGGLPNWHENIELLYCTGGKGAVQCGPERHDFVQGDMFVVNADTPHSVCSEGSVLYRCLIIDNSFCTENGIPISTLYFQPMIRDENMGQLFRQVSNAYENYDENNVCAVADIRCAVLQLLRALCYSYTVERPSQTGTAANIHVKEAMVYLRQNLSKQIGLDDISAYVGISKYHLSREFKMFTGKTIVQTLNMMRCTEAKSMIENGIGVSTAAMSCGFENLSYFSRAFKKVFGRLPSSFVPGSVRGRAAHMVVEQEDFCS